MAREPYLTSAFNLNSLAGKRQLQDQMLKWDLNQMLTSGVNPFHITSLLKTHQ